MAPCIRFFLFWFAAIHAAGLVDAQSTDSKKITVTFELHSPELAEDTQVFLTGSLPSLGNWDPANTVMKPIGDHRWSLAIGSNADDPIEYKYTLGSWDREGADVDGHRLQNFVIQPASDTTIRDRIDFWTTGMSDQVKGQITGTVKYHRRLEYEGLLPRDVIVWLPPGYDESSERYPVLYMHDGQNIIDPKTSAFGVDWQVDESLTRLIELKKIKPLIVVGIYNTRERSKDYLPGQQGTRYAKFVCQHLKPLIDKTYRTDCSRESTAVAGSSAGGLCAFTMAWENADVFSKAICMSSAFKYERSDGTISVNYLPQFIAAKQPLNPPYVYFDNGGVGLETLLQPGIDEMIAAMKNKGLEAGKDFAWKCYPKSSHNEASWAERLPAALELIFGDR